ncbi:PIR Superfamily Protein [Plasmodium ovale wallikeri]|uniref:PIR Superfamily Protein n=1 Tax=Plasmodium ovale wallikeri TaxID=864142 RepID=A0A1A9AIV6_PLAOA|nr:PIR Superfamily Protein [Plasmodium ovale wallikeri]
MADQDNMDYLNSKIKYNLLNKKFYGTSYDKYCSEIKEELHYYKDIDELCNKLCANFQKVLVTLFSDPNNTEECKNLNYWLYNEVHNMYSDKITGDISTSLVIRKFDAVWKNYDQNNQCKFDIYNIKRDDFEKLKVVYDFYQDYQTIQHRITAQEKKCSSNLFKYIENSKEQYNHFDTTCSKSKEGDNLHICKEFEYIKNVDRSIDISKVSCTESKELQKRIEQHDGSSREGGMESSHMYQDSQVQHGASTHSISSQIAMAIIFPFFGIILILFILHKFTPFGSLLRGYLLKNKLIRFKMDGEGIDDLLDNTYDFEGTKLEKGQHIRYHPL